MVERPALARTVVFFPQNGSPARAAMVTGTRPDSLVADLAVFQANVPLPDAHTGVPHKSELTPAQLDGVKQPDGSLDATAYWDWPA